MSAPALTGDSGPWWSALPEYEPPLRDDPDDPTTPWFPPRPRARRRLRLRAGVVHRDCPVWDEQGTTREQLWRLLCLVLEVLDGRRPVGHLHGAVAGHIHEALLTRSRYTAHSGWQHRLRSLHTCRPAPGVIELCGTVFVSSPTPKHTNVITLAGRVEQRHGHWHCTDLRPLYAGAHTPAQRREGRIRRVG